MEQLSDPDPGSGIKHPGSATMCPIKLNYRYRFIFIRRRREGVSRRIAAAQALRRRLL
jgi:hypothetical protein